MTVAMHCEGCDYPMWYSERMPLAGTLPLPADWVDKDGNHPKMGERIVCQSCGAQFSSRLPLSQVREVSP